MLVFPAISAKSRGDVRLLQRLAAVLAGRARTGRLFEPSLLISSNRTREFSVTAVLALIDGLFASIPCIAASERVENKDLGFARIYDGIGHRIARGPIGPRSTSCYPVLTSGSFK
jgi:hypothetical protein